MFKTIIITSYFFFNLINSSFANIEIRFLDLNYIIENSKSGKEINLILQSKNKQNLELIKKSQENINIFQKDIESKKNILSQNEIDKSNNELRNQIEVYNRLKKEKEREFIELRQKYLNILLNELNNIIVLYSKNNEIDIIIKKENMITGKKNLDVTDVILEQLNKVKIDLKWN